VQEAQIEIIGQHSLYGDILPDGPKVWVKIIKGAAQADVMHLVCGNPQSVFEYGFGQPLVDFVERFGGLQAIEP